MEDDEGMCETCGGTAEIDCTECDGSGYDDEYECDCNECDGLGLVPCPECG